MVKTVKEEIDVEALQKRVEDLEKTLALVLASMPVWIGYDESDARFMEDWYKGVRKEQEINTRGIRD